MRYPEFTAVVIAVVLSANAFGADTYKQPTIKIDSSEGSIQIGDVELRNEDGVKPYISVEAAEKALGKPQENYKSGSDIEFYTWHRIHLLKA
jgi:hypothetical protein